MRTLTSATVAKLTAALALMIGLFLWLHEKAKVAQVLFATAEEAQAFFVSQGLHCHTGTDGVTPTVGNFFVADRPITLDDTHALSPRHRATRASSKGILWVSEIRGQYGDLCMVRPTSLSTRVWGNVYVEGDEDLIHRIEELYRNK